MLKVSNTGLEMALACLLIKRLPQETENIFTWKFTTECEEIRDKAFEPRPLRGLFHLHRVTVKGPLASLAVLPDVLSNIC